MDKEIQEFVKPLLGKECCRQRVGHPRSLWLGFGEKLFHGNKKLVDPYYGEWEIGTYYCAWRVVESKNILCGSTDAVDSVDELDKALKQIKFGCVVSLRQFASFDVRADFDTGIAVEFLATVSDDTQCFEVFNGPSHLAAEFTVGGGWKLGRSDLPWK